MQLGDDGDRSNVEDRRGSILSGTGVRLHVPSGVAYSISLPNASETVLHGSGAVLLEYRFRNRWTLATGVGVQVEPGGLTPWSAILPFRLGRIW